MHIGLTGNISTGKSTVYNILCQREDVLGFDADKVVHSLYSDSDVVDTLIAEFGSSIRGDDNLISRHKLRNLFLKDSSVRGVLESVFHPRVHQEYLETFDRLEQGQSLLADIPLLFEKETPYKFDKVITVACSADIQLSRLMSRSNLDKDIASAMIEKQVALSDKMRQSDIVIWNNAGLDLLQNQINLLEEYIF